MLIGYRSGVRPIRGEAAVRVLPLCYKITATILLKQISLLHSICRLNHLFRPRFCLRYKISALNNIPFLLG